MEAHDQPTAEWQPDVPWNALPRLTTTTLELETKLVLKHCIEARAALAELKQAAELLPNQSMLINLLPVLEARDSSKIENIVTTTDELFRFIDRDDAAADAATKEALRYRTALWEGFRSLDARPLSTTTAIDVCRGIKGIDIGIRRVPGTALAGDVSGKVIYTPPVGESLLRELLADWEQFMHGRTDIDPLIRMAVGHYQFEAIHPFSDGNGRTGRIMNVLFLVDQRLLTLPILYLSRYIVANKAMYYDLLMSVTREQRWEPWILYILQGVKETALWTTEKIHQVIRLEDQTISRVKQTAPKIYSRELIDVVFSQPYCRISHLVSAGVGNRQSASKYLKTLTEQGILQNVQIGRERLFINTELLRLFVE
jgi:Fic family protein